MSGSLTILVSPDGIIATLQSYEAGPATLRSYMGQIIVIVGSFVVLTEHLCHFG